MDLETAQTNTTVKLPILKQGEYEIWRLRIVQYFQVQDYAPWDVIKNGNSFKHVARTTANADGTSISTIPGPVTTEEKAQKKNDVKARTMLLMALPNEHLLTFNQYRDAKTLFDVIQIRFGDNDATKKTQKILLKQMYENFNATSTGSLPSEWNTHIVVWRNKPDLDTMSFDNLYNIFKIVEQEVKRTVTISSSSGSQHMAFLSSSGSTNKVDTANIQVSTVNTPVSTASTHVNTANLSDATIYAFLANHPNGSQLVHEDLEQIHEDDLEEMDLKWQLALLSMRARRGPSGNKESRGLGIKTAKKRTVVWKKLLLKQWWWLLMGLVSWLDLYGSEDPLKLLNTQYDNLRIEFNKSEFDLATYKRGLASVEEQLVFYKKNEGHPQKEDQGYVDSGCSRHMTGNISYLSDFKDSLEDLFTLGEELMVAKLLVKGTLDCKLDFEVKYAPELLGRTPALSFMTPFGCHVIILNTLDHLGKFDGKSDDGFFIGYLLTSKAFRVYNIRTRKVEENLHIRFLEDKPIVTGDGLKWLFDIDSLTKSMNYVPVVAGTNSNDFAGLKESNGEGHSSKETKSCQDYIVISLWKDGLLFDSSSENSSDDEPQPSSYVEKKDDEGISKASRVDDQERPESNTPNINIVGLSINTTSANFKTDSLNINIVSPTVITIRSNHPHYVSDMFSLGDNATHEATHANLFGDETGLDMSNITTTYQVLTTPNTRIHKVHSLDHVIGDIQSSIQTTGMTKNTNEHGFISDVYEGKTHEDLHTCLFACFLSQEEPKRIAKALSDPTWVEAMQEELLQFKLQKV
ncbi:ribonuclease H-like domain-containing protein [Tanacetum coccineum]